MGRTTGTQSHRAGPERPLRALLVGLRPRLVLAFVLVALVSGIAAAGASYRSARNTVLSSAQQEVLDAFKSGLEALASQGSIQLPPDQETLDLISANVSGQSLALYGSRRSAGGLSPGDVPAELRAAVHKRNRLVWQRVERGGEPYLVYGTPVTTTNGLPSGIEVYARSSLIGPERSIDDLARSAATTMGFSLFVAVALALVASQGVLRPVRELRKGARRLAAGRLDTRLAARGSDELAELVRTFNGTAAALERSVEELRRMEANARRFVADVSHELRTPLAAMTAVTDTLDEEAELLDGDGAVAARLVSAETRKLTQLVENLMEISRFDAGRAVLRVDEVDLAAAVTATLAARGWTDDVEASLPAGVTARLDRRRLDVIVANLVGNALRHGAPPVVVRVATEVDDDTAGAGWVTITVTDHGPGLAPEILPHVFDRFSKADHARARSEGSGLGMAIAWENARLHGGTVEAANEPGAGARFTVRLPRRMPEPAG